MFKCGLYHGLLCDRGNSVPQFPSCTRGFRCLPPSDVVRSKGLTEGKGKAQHLTQDMAPAFIASRWPSRDWVDQEPTPGCVLNSFFLPRGYQQEPYPGDIFGAAGDQRFSPLLAQLLLFPSCLCPSFLSMPSSALAAPSPSPILSSLCMRGSRGGPSHCTIFGP